MMYDPFARGQHPVGVRTVEIADTDRPDRTLRVELWYPADPRLLGDDLQPSKQDVYAVFGAHRARQEALRDAEPSVGARPALVFSHGMAGHRRQSTFFCTHLASHGYVVAAPDHAGSTLSDLVGMALDREAVPAGEREAMLERYVADLAEGALAAFAAQGIGVRAVV